MNVRRGILTFRFVVLRCSQLMSGWARDELLSLPSLVLLSVYLFISISLCLYLIIQLSVTISTYLSIYLSIYHLSIYLYIYHSICLSVYISLCLYLIIYISLYLSLTYIYEFVQFTRVFFPVPPRICILLLLTLSRATPPTAIDIFLAVCVWCAIDRFH